MGSWLCCQTVQRVTYESYLAISAMPLAQAAWSGVQESASFRLMLAPWLIKIFTTVRLLSKTAWWSADKPEKSKCGFYDYVPVLWWMPSKLECKQKRADHESNFPRKSWNKQQKLFSNLLFFQWKERYFDFKEHAFRLLKVHQCPP